MYVIKVTNHLYKKAYYVSQATLVRSLKKAVKFETKEAAEKFLREIYLASHDIAEVIEQ